jgi:hypothetical protein
MNQSTTANAPEEEEEEEERQRPSFLPKCGY